MSGMTRMRRGAAAVAAGCAAAACATMLTAGCGAGGPAPAATAGPAKRPAVSVLPPGPQRRALAASYLAIARAGNRRLETDFGLLHKAGRTNLAAAKAGLRDAVATERLFDRRLLHIAFPPAVKAVARTLYRLNQARARLTAQVASVATLRRLHRAEPRLAAANRPVERAVRIIRRQLGLPPPQTS